jgi:hypothetical protein
MIDPVMDKIDKHLSHPTLVVELLEGVCSFLPLCKDTDNLNEKTIGLQPHKEYLPDDAMGRPPMHEEFESDLISAAD